MTMAESRSLEPSDSIEVAVDASMWWNAAGIAVRRGETYRLVARGEWLDAGIRTGAAGYKKNLLKPFEPCRRMRHADWFSLIAALHASSSLAMRKPAAGNFLTGWFDSRRHGVGTADEESQLVNVGERADLTVLRDGYLYLFANDAAFAYANNHGSIKVTVSRLN